MPHHELAVLETRRSTRTRVAQGLATSEILTEFRLLRQEIGWALRSHVADAAPTSDVLGAEIVLHDALDDAAFLAALAVDEREAELQRVRAARAGEELRLAAMLEQLPAVVMIADAPAGQGSLGHPEIKQMTRRVGVPVPAGGNPNEWQGFHQDGTIQTGEVVVGEEIVTCAMTGSGAPYQSTPLRFVTRPALWSQASRSSRTSRSARRSSKRRRRI
jgi:hypothetical protein